MEHNAPDYGGICIDFNSAVHYSTIRFKGMGAFPTIYINKAFFEDGYMRDHMFILQTSTKNHNGRDVYSNYCKPSPAAIIPFPNTLIEPENKPVHVVPGHDLVTHRMSAPLTTHELTTIWEMIKYRAKRMEEELWITTGHFLTLMGAEEFGDLRRCDFTHAVEYLVSFDTTKLAT